MVLIIPTLVLLWRIDSFRMRPRLAATGFLACFAALLGTALTVEQEDWETFAGNSYVSKFSHSGFAATFDLMAHGYLDAGATLTERLKTVPEATCTPSAKPPHIILVHDEFSFDIRVAPGVKVPAITAATSGHPTAGGATSSPKAPAGRAGTPSTTCSPDCPRARLDALPIT